jgi:hypothetical protein
LNQPTFVPLPLIYCVAPKGKVPGTVVQHDPAAVHFSKMSGEALRQAHDPQAVGSK